MIQIPVGATSVTLYFYFIDPTTGGPKISAALTDIDLIYTRERCTPVKNDISALAAINGAWNNLEAYEADWVNAPGIYRIDCPNAAFADGKVQDGAGAEDVRRVSLYVIDGSGDDNFICDPPSTDIILTPLTDARIGYLDELAAANMPADITALAVAIAAIPITTVNDILAGDVDSTGVAMTLAKALEVIVAVVGGNVSVSGNEVSFKGRDGTSEVINVDLDGSGDRSNSTIP